MIIGIDAAKLSTAQPTGVEVATTDLIKVILKNDTQNIYWLYSPQSIALDLPWGDRVKNIVVPGKRFWTQRYLSRVLRQNPPDIFWSPSHILPNYLPKKCVATVHDLAFHLFPDSYSFKERWLSTWAVKKAIKHASRLVAVSQQTKKELKRHFNVPGEQIEVVYHALRSDFISADGDFAATFPGLDKYFLCIGRLELRKNLPNIIRAFAKFSSNHPEVKLVLAGSSGYGYNQIKALIKKIKLTGKVVILNYVSAEHLPMLYSESLGLLFVSQCEGFGLPILEAWASRAPVLTSNVGAMAEIAGNAAVLVDPNDIAKIAEGMRNLLTDTGLRQRCIDKGRQRLAEFSWDKSAQKMIELWTKL